MKNFLTYQFLIRSGLAIVFFANSLKAFFAPKEFIEIVERAFFAGALPVSAETFVVIIGINDVLVAILLLWGIRTRLVAIWAVLWIIGATVTQAALLEALEEVGFLAMAVALIYDRQMNT